MTSTKNPPKNPQPVTSELQMFDRWNTEAVSALINRKTSRGRKPAFLFLGQREANLLRYHLGTAFGPESVRTLKNLYYMGLEVVELDTETYFRTAGLKRVQGLEEALNRRPNHHDLEASSFWRFAIL
ncbi:MAG: hypothetical protein GWO24_33935 [Akkermansiaceae bacterium]|nr:hypothetical protein [Akkermansiaceae bacterium]